MLWVSAILILVSVGAFTVALEGGPELPLIVDQVIHTRIPWAILGSVWVGLAFGIVAMIRKRSLLRWIVFVPLVAVAALSSVYLTQWSVLPESTLRVAVGDPFPGYTLPDHDDVVRSRVASTPRAPELYIFYRGDW